MGITSFSQARHSHSVYFKPYESNGEAWRITFTRLLWALVLFQLFMTGLFSLQPPHILSFAMVPLLVYTVWWAWSMVHDFDGLSEYLALSSVREVQRGEEVEGVVGVREGVPRSQRSVTGSLTLPWHRFAPDFFKTSILKQYRLEHIMC